MPCGARRLFVDLLPFRERRDTLDCTKHGPERGRSVSVVGDDFVSLSRPDHPSRFETSFRSEFAIRVQIVLALKFKKSALLQKAAELLEIRFRHSAALDLAVRCAIAGPAIAAKLREQGGTAVLVQNDSVTVAQDCACRKLIIDLGDARHTVLFLWRGRSG